MIRIRPDPDPKHCLYQLKIKVLKVRINKSFSVIVPRITGWDISERILLDRSSINHALLLENVDCEYTSLANLCGPPDHQVGVAPDPHNTTREAG